jgi:hypothetical protein
LSVNVRNDKFDLLAGFGGRCHLIWSVWIVKVREGLGD